MPARADAFEKQGRMFDMSIPAEDGYSYDERSCRKTPSPTTEPQAQARTPQQSHCQSPTLHHANGTVSARRRCGLELLRTAVAVHLHVSSSILLVSRKIIVRHCNRRSICSPAQPCSRAPGTLACLHRRRQRAARPRTTAQWREGVGLV